MAEGDHYPKCFDPYLRYAIATNFRTFEFFDEKKKFKLFFLVELNEGIQGKAFATAMNNHNSSFAVEVGPLAQVEKNTRYATMRSNKAAVTGLDSQAVSIWETYVSRVELSLPLKTLAQASDTVAERSPTAELIFGTHLDRGVRRRLPICGRTISLKRFGNAGLGHLGPESGQGTGSGKG